MQKKDFMKPIMWFIQPIISTLGYHLAREVVQIVKTKTKKEIEKAKRNKK